MLLSGQLQTPNLLLTGPEKGEGGREGWGGGGGFTL